jgi:hypothetical protein
VKQTLYQSAHEQERDENRDERETDRDPGELDLAGGFVIRFVPLAQQNRQ